MREHERVARIQIFGKTEDQSLDVEASRTALRSLEKEINAQSSGSKSTDEIAWGFIKVANETMARPIRALTEARGYSTSKHILRCAQRSVVVLTCQLLRRRCWPARVFGREPARYQDRADPPLLLSPQRVRHGPSRPRVRAAGAVV